MPVGAFSGSHTPSHDPWLAALVERCPSMECFGVPAIGIDEWVKRMVADSGRERAPLAGSVELTHRCNLNCVQCYCNLPVSDGAAQDRELQYDEVCDIIDQIAAQGCLWLLLTGGEPLLRPDFLDIYAYAKKKGLLVTLFTNGTLLTGQVADYLAEWPPRKVEITLHGVTKETFEEVTRVPGSYERCMRGIQTILQRGIPLELKTTVTTVNKHELWDIKRYVEGLGIDFRFDALLQPRYDGSKQPYAVRLSPQEVLELDMADKDRRLKFEELCESYWGAPATDHLYLCGAGLHMFHIDPYGYLTPCMTNRAHAYDLRDGSFAQGWREYLPAVRSLRVERVTKCRTCPEKSLCGQCPAWSYLEHGDLESPSEYLCELSHMRAEAFREGYCREEQTDGIH